jgi:translation initiation factor IF-2
LVIKTPVVTILGHVDHGKTTLLDAIRGSDVAGKEAGGITQKVGAFQIEFKGKKITFIDTPGHEAFAKMRSRGAGAADIAILVVAANDGVQAQTRESIAHIKASEIPFIVAITKIDMPNISIDKVKKQLSVAGVQVEGMGGDVVCIQVSAKNKIGLDELLDMILLIWEMKNENSKPQNPKTLKTKKTKKTSKEQKESVIASEKSERGNLINKKIATSPSAPRNDNYSDDNRFVVIESYLDNKKGCVIHAIVKSGSFKIGDKVYIEGVEGKIRTLMNDKGQHLEEVGDGDPVEILGFEKVPPVGSVGMDENTNRRMNELKNRRIEEEKLKIEEKEKAEKVASVKSEESVESVPRESDSLISENPEVVEEAPEERKKLAVILKTDNEGSLEAIRASLPPEINLLLTGTGAVSEGDILLAKTTKAFVVGFNVEISGSAKKLAEIEAVSFKTYKIIYEMLTELQEVADSINEVVATEKIVGAAKILQDFLGTKSRIAGCKILEGKFHIGDKVRVERGEKIIGEAKIDSIKMFKKDVEKVVSGQECGFVLKPEVDFRLEDHIVFARPLGLKK